MDSFVVPVAIKIVYSIIDFRLSIYCLFCWLSSSEYASRPSFDQ